MFTYALLNLLFVMFVTGIMMLWGVRWPKLQGGPTRRNILFQAAAPLAILLALTAIFDSLMIYLKIFTYNPALISGLHIVLAPLEDFAYPLLACIMIPALWSYFSKQGRRND